MLEELKKYKLLVNFFVCDNEHSLCLLVSQYVTGNKEWWPKVY